MTARLNKDGLRGLKLISAARSSRKLSCTETCRTCALRLRAGFFRFGISGSAIGSSSCTQIPFSMSCPSPRWFISDGRARLRAWAAIADEHHPTERSETVNARSDRLRCHIASTSPVVSGRTELERSGLPVGLGVYFLGKRVTRYGVQDHCPTKVLGGQGATLLLVGKPHGWGNAPLSKQSPADLSAAIDTSPTALGTGRGVGVGYLPLVCVSSPGFGFEPSRIGVGIRFESLRVDSDGGTSKRSIGSMRCVAASDAAMQGASGNAS